MASVGRSRANRLLSSAFSAALVALAASSGFSRAAGDESGESGKDEERESEKGEKGSRAIRLEVSGFPSPATAGVAGTVRVTAVESSGETATGYRGRVRVRSSDSTASLPLEHHFGAADLGSFAFPVTLGTLGTWSITASDVASPTIQGTQSGIVVDASAPPASVRPFPQRIEFERYGSSEALARDWVPFARGAGYGASVQLVRGSSGRALELHFALGPNGGGQAGVTFAANPPTASGFSNAWDLSGVEALSLRARSTGGPLVVTCLVTCLDARSASGQTVYVTRFEVAPSDDETCYLSLVHLAWASWQTGGSRAPDMRRVVSLELMPDGLVTGAASLVLDDIAPARLPEHFASLVAPPSLPPVQLVVLSFDDCADTEGMSWIHDELQALGLAGKATFFVTTVYGDPDYASGPGWNWAQVQNAWKRFAAEGCELGNHTHSHNLDLAKSPATAIDGTTMSKGAWRAELRRAHEQLVRWTGVSPTVARAPRLEVSGDYFDALESLGYASDSSLELGGHFEPALSWPHGLRYGLAPDEWATWGPAGVFAHQSAVGRHRVRSLGLAQWDRGPSLVASSSFIENLTFSAFTPNPPTTWQAASQIVKDSFDRHLSGNRSPFHLGAHTFRFVFDPSTASQGEAVDWEGRRRILDDVLRHMLSKPRVRFVHASEALDLAGVPR
ncbi:polysaccharide deacetylase family protein [bacterium]|nr:polysaccharide deacetylase family protein [bacterium]